MIKLNKNPWKSHFFHKNPFFDRWFKHPTRFCCIFQAKKELFKNMALEVGWGGGTGGRPRSTQYCVRAYIHISIRTNVHINLPAPWTHECRNIYYESWIMVGLYVDQFCFIFFPLEHLFLHLTADIKLLRILQNKLMNFVE